MTLPGAPAAARTSVFLALWTMQVVEYAFVYCSVLTLKKFYTEPVAPVAQS